MFTLLERLKYRLSHISSKSWHWEMTEYVFEGRARGKACTYYWFKLPLSMFLLGFVVFYKVIQIPSRAVYIFLAWIFGYRFYYRTRDTHQEVTTKWNYFDYKTKKDGSRVRVAPWEILIFPMLVLIVLFFITQAPDWGLALLVLIILVSLSILMLYAFTRGWDNPQVKRARHYVWLTWNKLCPPLVVEEENSSRNSEEVSSF